MIAVRFILMPRSLRPIAGLLLCLFLQACGTKGALYLPRPDQQAEQRPAQSDQQRR